MPLKLFTAVRASIDAINGPPYPFAYVSVMTKVSAYGGPFIRAVTAFLSSLSATWFRPSSRRPNRAYAAFLIGTPSGNTTDVTDTDQADVTAYLLYLVLLRHTWPPAKTYPFTFLEIAKNTLVCVLIY